MNVFALLRGEKRPSNKTIILHGHMDTVGVEDFGSLSEFAFDSAKLEEKLKELDLSDNTLPKLLSLTVYKFLSE